MSTLYSFAIKDLGLTSSGSFQFKTTWERSATAAPWCGRRVRSQVGAARLTRKLCETFGDALSIVQGTRQSDCCWLERPSRGLLPLESKHLETVVGGVTTNGPLNCAETRQALERCDGALVAWRWRGFRAVQ